MNKKECLKEKLKESWEIIAYILISLSVITMIVVSSHFISKPVNKGSDNNVQQEVANTVTHKNCCENSERIYCCDNPIASHYMGYNELKTDQIDYSGISDICIYVNANSEVTFDYSIFFNDFIENNISVSDFYFRFYANGFNGEHTPIDVVADIVDNGSDTWKFTTNNFKVTFKNTNDFDCYYYMRDISFFTNPNETFMNAMYLKPVYKNLVDDLVVVCSNCHNLYQNGAFCKTNDFDKITLETNGEILELNVSKYHLYDEEIENRPSVVEVIKTDKTARIVLSCVGVIFGIMLLVLLYLGIKKIFKKAKR